MEKFAGFGTNIMPVFSVLVYGSPGHDADRAAEILGEPRPRVPICVIDVDRSDLSALSLSINNHRGYEIINQKMLPPVGVQPTLWHQGEGDAVDS